MQKETDMQKEADEAVRVMRGGGIILYPTAVSYTHLTLPTILLV